MGVIPGIVEDVSEALFQFLGKPFDLKDLERFPFKEWARQSERYSLFQQWYDGEPLNITTVDATTGKPIEKYPIKINPIKGTCQKHATTVIGVNIDSIRFGGLPFQIIPDLTEEQQDTKAKLEKAFMKLFHENGFGANFLSNLIKSQYLGGSVVAMKWLPDEKTIEISTPSVREFIGIPEGNNYFRLKEGWIVRKISKQIAMDYGYVPKMNEEQFYYIEYWNKTDYKIMVNGQVLKFKSGQLQEGENVFGIVPIVYTPHIRTTGFLGDSIITETIKGLIREMNLRWADVGDAVSDDSHGFVAIRNVANAAKTVNLGDGRPVIDLGSNISMGTTKADPDLFSVKTQSTSDPMLKLGAELYSMYRREANHPAVADGEDEGSQRSALTLATRMAPLVGEAELERVFLSIGLGEVARILVIMLSKKKLLDITEDMIDTYYTIQWQPMLPRDREALVQEAAVRAKGQLGTKAHLIGLFGDVQDPKAEVEKVLEESKKFAPLQPQAGFGGNNNNNGGASAPRKVT